MWLKARLLETSRKVDMPESPQSFRAIIQLGTRICQELEQRGQTHDLGNDRLRREISKRLDGGRIALPSHDGLYRYSFRGGIWKWMKREKWWLTLMVPVTLYVLLGWLVFFYTYYRVMFSFSLYWPSILLWSLLVLTIMVGNTTKSRVFLSLCALVPTAAMLALMLLEARAY